MTDELGTQVLATVNQMRSDLSAHANGEETDIKEIRSDIVTIKDDLNDWRLAAERRHSELVGSIMSYVDSTNEMREAFLHVEGKPDFTGHKSDHLTRKQFADWAADVKTDVIKNTIKVGFLGLLGWIGFILWEAFLRGPHK